MRQPPRVGVALALCVAMLAAPAHAAVRSVYLVSHGWHVGLVLARDDLATIGVREHGALRAFRYVEVGWGDGDYYPARRGTIPLALRAAFHSRWSVLQIVGFDRSVTETFPRAKILEVDVSSRGLSALARYVDATAVMDEDGCRIVVASAQYGFGFFYLARGHYSLRNNSNHWLARGLEIAGCPIDADAAVTAGALLHQAARFARVVRPGVFVRASEETAARCHGT